MPQLATWNIWLVNRGEQPLLYYRYITENEDDVEKIFFSIAKAFDGSDADGMVLLRSDYPMPKVWP